MRPDTGMAAQVPPISWASITTAGLGTLEVGKGSHRNLWVGDHRCQCRVLGPDLLIWKHLGFLGPFCTWSPERSSEECCGSAECLWRCLETSASQKMREGSLVLSAQKACLKCPAWAATLAIPSQHLCPTASSSHHRLSFSHPSQVRRHHH